MNKQRVLELADTLEHHAKEQKGLRGVGFNMRTWASKTRGHIRDRVDDCGTVACLAGWAYMLRFQTVTARRLLAVTDIGKDWRIPTCAADYLGLDTPQTELLFRPNISVCDWDQITADQAVKVLRHLAKTGEVDWGVAGLQTRRR